MTLHEVEHTLCIGDSIGSERSLYLVGGVCLGWAYAQMNLTSVGGVYNQWEEPVWEGPVRNM